ncbi:MAG: ParB/RepB/Spo0J family partition protein [Clostridia bacterium]|nr:ParB/RepB/Spo0J family partition protein [Clostridia bacterium]
MAKKRSFSEARGLDSLFTENEPGSAGGGVVSLRLSSVEPKADQPRKSFDDDALASLSESIAKNGVIQPILVRALPGGMYQIIAGERRWRASKLAGLTEIPAIIMEADELHTAELALIENLQRENLNPYEEAEAYYMLMSGFGLTQEEVAGRIGKSRSALANAVRLLELPDDVAALLKNGDISAGHARTLLGLKNPEDMLPLAERIVKEGLSVRETEAAVKALNKKKKEKVEKEEDTLRIDYVAELEKKVTGLSGRYCKIKTKGARKTVTVEYGGEGDLEALLSLICGAKITEE